MLGAREQLLLFCGLMVTGCGFMAFSYKAPNGRRYQLTEGQRTHYERTQAQLHAALQTLEAGMPDGARTDRQQLKLAARRCELYATFIKDAPAEPVAKFHSAADVLRDDQRVACREADRIKEQIAKAERLERRTRMSAKQIRERLLKDSQSAYRGNCPCPFYRDRCGRRSGRRSAYSRHGGRSVLCYTRDVTPKMIEAYRAGRR